MNEPREGLVRRLVPTPVGRLTLVASRGGLAAVLWENEDPKRVRLGPMRDEPEHPLLVETERQLGDYFAGTRTSFGIALDLAGTEFQKTVWAALLAIPYGETRSYADIARQIGRPAAIRAVGAANGRNPVSIIVPCHRLVGTSGALTGFAGGLAAKEWLLNLERQHWNEESAALSAVVGLSAAVKRGRLSTTIRWPSGTATALAQTEPNVDSESSSQLPS